MPVELIPCQAQQHCVVCGGSGKTIYRNLADRLFGSPGTWNISRCDRIDCGVLWLNPQPLADEIGKAYSNYYTHQDKTEKGGFRRSLIAGGRRLLLATLLLLTGLRKEYEAVRGMHLSGRRPGRLLEIGCGEGQFLSTMSARGWKVEGLEADPAAAAAANRKYGIRVHVGQLIAVNLPGSTYDAITLNHSIEHVHNPVELLRECRRLLRPGGLLVCVTPNADSWGRIRYGENWRGLEPPRHIHIFARNSLARLAEIAGFEKHRTYTTTVNNWIIDSASRALASDLPGGSPGRASALAAMATQAWLSVRNRFRGDIGEECVLVAEHELPEQTSISRETQVCAVIVVFHPDWDQLLRQILALRAQVDTAVFVDNSADAAVQLRLAQIAGDFDADIITPPANLGVAAAHNLGIEHARSKHATHVLLMDQDSIPAEDMVLRLLNAEQTLVRQAKPVAALGPRVVETFDDTERTDAIPAAADMLISSGTLIRLAIIDCVGAMDETLFIDQVDTEWCLRARAMNLACYAVSDALMTHDLGSARIRLWMGRHYQIPLHAPVRHYFNFRNSILVYRRDYVSSAWMFRDALRLTKLFVYFGLIARERRRHFPMMLRGILDGLRGVTGNPFPPGHASVTDGEKA